MTSTAAVRVCAQAILAAIAEHGNNGAAMAPGIRAALATLMTEPDLLERGDFAIVAPPANIHSFTALDDGTYGITVVNGAHKSERRYYDPPAGTYEVRAGRNVR